MSFSYSQSYYTATPQPAVDFGSIAVSAQQNQYQSLQYNQQLNENANQRRIANKSTWDNYRESAFVAYKNNDFYRCLSNYNYSKSLGYYDPEFEYIAGVSSYNIWQIEKIASYKRLAKELLKLSKKHGSIDADLFIEKIK